MMRNSLQSMKLLAFSAAFACLVLASGAAGAGFVSSALAQSADQLGQLGLGGGDTPVSIDADRLEVFDDRKEAVFSGNVILKQGDVSLQTSRLRVFYTGGAQEEQGTIERLEADGKVVVRSREQTATGDRATFKVSERVIRVLGNVVLSQGQNVIRGTELLVNLESGTSRLVSAGGTGQRVRGLFLPGTVQDRQ